MTSLIKQKRINLNTGLPFPLIGFGTYKIVGVGNISNCLDAALRSGYRSIDTAACYRNEVDIGTALQYLLPQHNLRREDIFITTKLFTTDHGINSSAALFKSMNALGVNYIDLYLIHWPGASSVAAHSTDNAHLRRQSWHELVKLHKQGIIRNLGVSNYTIRHLEELISDCAGVVPAVNQVELHPRYPQTQLLRYCQERNILVQAYCSLGGTPSNRQSENSLLSDPIVKECAETVGCTPAQILLFWAVNKNVAVIPKSVTPARIRQNIELDFDVPQSVLHKLDSISIREKYAWDPEIVT